MGELQRLLRNKVICPQVHVRLALGSARRPIVDSRVLNVDLSCWARHTLSLYLFCAVLACVSTVLRSTVKLDTIEI